MNNMITLQHVEIKASFETSMHVIGHVFKKTLYKRLLGMVSRDALNEIASEVDRLRYLGNNPSSCGCVMRSTHGLHCACELSRYTADSITVESVHIFRRRLCFSDQGLCEVEVSIKEEIETISKSNSSVKCSTSCSEPPQPTRIIPILDQFVPFIQGFIRDVVDVKADGNSGYWSIVALLGMREDSWPLVCNELIKELDRWSHEYMNLFGGTERFKQLRLSLLVDGFSKVSVDKWMDITEMRYVIALRYNVILVSLTFFPLRSQPPPDSSGHRMICVGHIFGNHFVQAH
ncbi:hypothetical protein GmHk_02G003815 [Glycine max]|nr:hypothetical protein GmHk_02G003815 [Glycine max]